MLQLQGSGERLWKASDEIESGAAQSYYSLKIRLRKGGAGGLKLQQAQMIPFLRCEEVDT